MKLIIYGTSFVILSFAAYATGYCPTYFSPAHQKGRIQYRDYRYQANTKIDTAYFNLYNNIYNTLTRILATVTKPQSSLKLAFENFPKKKLTNETLTKFEKIYTYVNDEIQNCFSTYVFSVFGTLDVTPFGAIGPTYIAGIMDLNMNMIVEDFFSRNFCDEPQKHSQNDIILTMSKVRGIIKPFDDKLIATINNLVPRVAERFVNTTAAVNSAIKEISAFTLKINNCTKAASMEDCIKKLIQPTDDGHGECIKCKLGNIIRNVHDEYSTVVNDFQILSMEIAYSQDLNFLYEITRKLDELTSTYLD